MDKYQIVYWVRNGLLDYYLQQRRRVNTDEDGRFILAMSNTNIVKSVLYGDVGYYIATIREMITYSYGWRKGILRRHLRVLKALAKYWEEAQ
jgi:hypothetical protein